MRKTAVTFVSMGKFTRRVTARGKSCGTGIVKVTLRTMTPAERLLADQGVAEMSVACFACWRNFASQFSLCSLAAMPAMSMAAKVSEPTGASLCGGRSSGCRPLGASM